MSTATMTKRKLNVLTDDQVEQFIEEGYTIVREAFSREDGAVALDFLWNVVKEDEGVDVNDRATWDRRFIHVKKGFGDPPFRKVAHSPRMTAAFNDVMGEGRWHPINGLGWWPITFPNFDPKPWVAPERGWHVDGIQFHHHVNSPDQGLLPIPIFSDIEPGGGGTAISVGSHKITARILQDAEPDGLHVGELAKAVNAHPKEKVVELSGRLGDIVLLHPFMLHSNSANCGEVPRIICNPCIRLRGGCGRVLVGGTGDCERAELTPCHSERSEESRSQPATSGFFAFGSE